MAERSDNTNVSKPIINPILALRKYLQVVSDLEDELNIKQKGVLPLNTLLKLKQQKETNTNTVVKLDNRSEAKRQYDLMRGELVREANTRLKAYEKSGIDNVARYVPIAGTYALQGQVDLLKQSGRKEEARELSPWVAVSAAGDLATLGAGMKYPIHTAAGVVGATVGGNVGRHYGNELVGSLAGGFVGGGIPVFYNSRTVQLYRLSKELNKSARNTKLINKDIEVVSPYGITQGSGLNTYSKYDVGFHFSPRWSPTSIAILKLTGSPFIRTGYQLTSENIPYMIAKDKGIWTSLYNPELYRGVNPGNTPLENVIALDLIGPNYKYANRFEGRGNTSYFTTDGNSINLSKNATIKREELPLKVSGEIQGLENKYVHRLTSYGGKQLGMIGDDFIFLDPNNTRFTYKRKNYSFDNYDLYLEGLKKLHDEYISNLTDLLKLLYININTVSEKPSLVSPHDDIYKLTKRRTRDLIDNFYKSDEYKDRFIREISSKTHPLLRLSIYSPESQYDKFISNLERTHDNYNVGIFNSPTTVGEYTNEPVMISLNTKSHMYDPNTTIHHEFGHASYSPLLKTNDEWSGVASVIKHNKNLIGDAKNNLLPDARSFYTDEYINYISDQEELRLRVIPVVEEMFENGWTAEDAFNNSKELKQSNLKDLFNKDYIIKLLEGMLVMSPLIASNNE